MGTAAHRLTADDVIELHRKHPEVFGYELVDGELVEVSPAGLPHGRIIARMAGALDAYLGHHGGGRVYVDGGFVLPLRDDPERLRGPDIAFVSDETLSRVGGEPESGFARFAPDIAFEVDSPSNTDEDVPGKVQDYLDAGVRLVWVIRPRNRSAMVYHADGSARLLRENDTLDGEDVLPGFSVGVRKLLE
jgi:Uma2 family endonuclease